MLHYALAWRPNADSVGTDLATLGAMQLLPRVDIRLDVDRLDAFLPQIEDRDRVVALIPGLFLRTSSHWPPERHIAPVCAGVHIDGEDAWGLPADSLDGAGLDALRACGPILCRDERTAARLEKLGVPHQVIGCLTLALQRPDVPRKGGVVCCDAPESVVSALRELAESVTTVSHRLENASRNFGERMAAARALLETYAAADMVITRRLHCAMACLAIGTPVLLLYNSGYEDIARFAPLDSMVRAMPADAFLRQLQEEGLPAPWENPADMPAIRSAMHQAVADGLARAEGMPLPLVPPEEAAHWRSSRLMRMADSAADRIADLERQQMDAWVEKFSMLDREDSAKTILTGLLEGLGYSRDASKATRPRLRSAELNDLVRQAWEALDALGWPEHND